MRYQAEQLGRDAVRDNHIFPGDILDIVEIILRCHLGNGNQLYAVLFAVRGNLSIYYQNQARRRYLIDNPKRDRIENYESSNDAYVVEDYDRGAFAENITIQS